jgi:glycogen operon protein
MQLLHDAGIEVILDVVYNHTAEGNHMGPTLSFRGLDNASYYKLVPGDERHYVDFTGCGNAFDLDHPRVLQLVMDSLRYWVEEMHVDGFRFDLASTLARRDGKFDTHAGFLDAVGQDPVLSRVKLIAEPWDVGEHGYQLGNFPPGWAEWNDGYRDTVRRFWTGEKGLIGELASRLTGSSDIFEKRGRRPWASINFITAHDGFTLHDLVSYNAKHNQANLEDNRDGTDANHSWNCGAEGATDDPRVLALREQQKRNLLATLLLSQGVPMLVAGDEFGRTQGGNNNAYCHDDEIGWIDWVGIDEAGRRLLRFVTDLFRLRREHIVFHRYRFFRGRPIRGTDIKDMYWLRPDGEEKTLADWGVPHARCLSFVLSGEAGEYHLTSLGEPEPDDTFLVILNAGDQEVTCKIPPHAGRHWASLIDTAANDADAGGRAYEAGQTYAVQPRSVVMLVQRRDLQGADEAGPALP